MRSVPNPHQPPQGVYFDTLSVMYQNEKSGICFQMVINLMIYKYSWIERKCQYWCEINLYQLVSSTVHRFIIGSSSVHQYISSSVYLFISSSSVLQLIISSSLHHQFSNSSSVHQFIISSAVHHQFIRSSISSSVHQFIS